MATTITKAQAVKLMQVALFTAATRNRSFVNVLTDQTPAPKSAMPDKPGTRQTSFTAPVVRIDDLKTTAGDAVDMQITYQLRKKPTMGDRKLEGRGEDLTFASYSIGVDQARHMVDTGGRMTQKRTRHDLMNTARTMLGSYFNALQDQIATVHLAGARGDFTAPDIILPQVSDPDYQRIMVNEVTPPTWGRHFFGGDATKLADVDSADILTLATIDNLALYLAELASPVAPVKLSADELAGEDPYYVLYVTPRQWNDFYTSTSGKDWQAMASRAVNRGKGFSSPLFMGECAMWRNILIRQYGGMPIRFNSGSTVAVCKNDKAASVENVTTKANIDRAILLGGQALAVAYGASNGAHFSFNEQKVDHNNSTEISIGWINGIKKIRFPNSAGFVEDMGVIAVDTAITTGYHAGAAKVN